MCSFKDVWRNNTWINYDLTDLPRMQAFVATSAPWNLECSLSPSIVLPQGRTVMSVHERGIRWNYDCFPIYILVFFLLPVGRDGSVVGSGAFRPEGHMFESHSSRHVGTL